MTALQIGTLALVATLGMLLVGWWAMRRIDPTLPRLACWLDIHPAERQQQAFMRWRTSAEAARGIQVVMTLEERVACPHCTSATAWHTVQTMRIRDLGILQLDERTKLKLELRHKVPVGEVIRSAEQ